MFQTAYVGIWTPKFEPDMIEEIHWPSWVDQWDAKIHYQHQNRKWHTKDCLQCNISNSSTYSSSLYVGGKMRGFPPVGVLQQLRSFVWASWGTDFRYLQAKYLQTSKKYINLMGKSRADHCNGALLWSREPWDKFDYTINLRYGHYYISIQFTWSHCRWWVLIFSVGHSSFCPP